MHLVWEEIEDVLHGLGEDRGWTSKPDFCLGGDRGWTLLASLLCVLIDIEVFLHVIDISLKCVSIGKYGSEFWLRLIQHQHVYPL